MKTTDNGPLTTDKAARGFTLIEIMVVVVIIVLMVGLAVPVFRVINGSRSEAGATNVIAAMLNRARTDAIGVQQPYGVAFVYNKNSQLYDMAEVIQVQNQSQYWSSTTVPLTVPLQGYISTTIGSNTYYFVNVSNDPGNPPLPNVKSGPSGSPPTAPSGFQLVAGPPIDIAPDTDLIPLPLGIGVQTVCNCSMSGTPPVRSSNGYLSNGVIMFDGKGRIASIPYAISQYGKLGIAAGLANSYPTVNSNITQGVQSQFGLVVFQNDAYQSHRWQAPTLAAEVVYCERPPAPDSNGISPGFDDYSKVGNPTQQQADAWLDQNATPLLINRYTGTLIRGE
jgi:prepilin-type N-terminal cleavage/methylation domain-containing protein